MYHEHMDTIERLTDEEAGRLIKALFRYSTDGIVPSFDDRFMDLAFSMFKAAIDRDSAAYERKCERNRNNINQRWNKENTEEYERIETNTDEYDSKNGIPKIPNTNTNINTTTKTKTKTTTKTNTSHSIECVNTHALRTSEQSKNFDAWLTDKCPYIAKHYTLPTDTELAKLVDQFGANMVADVCEQIENRADLRKKYTNLYRTLLNWLKRESEKNMSNDERERNKRLESYAAVAAEFLNTEIRDEGELSAAIPF